jgi:hypothetical protein
MSPDYRLLLHVKTKNGFERLVQKSSGAAGHSENGVLHLVERRQLKKFQENFTAQVRKKPWRMSKYHFSPAGITFVLKES